MSSYSLDARNILCPLPVIRTQDKIAELQPGSLLEVICTDPGVVHDIPTWCRINGHEVLNIDQQDEQIVIRICVGET